MSRAQRIIQYEARGPSDDSAFILDVQTCRQAKMDTGPKPAQEAGKATHRGNADAILYAAHRSPGAMMNRGSRRTIPCKPRAFVDSFSPVFGRFPESKW